MYELNEIASIANKYADDIQSATEAKAKIIRGEFTFTEFQSKVIDVCKNLYANIVIFDASCVKAEDFLNAARDLKLHINKDVRIIVLYPNLTNEVVLQQLYVYGIYDVVKPIINENEMSDLEINNLIINELKWAIQEPVDFSKVVDSLSVELITQYVSNTVITENPENEKANKKRNDLSLLKKPRLMCFYNDDNSKFVELEKDGKYNIVGYQKATEENLANQDLNAIDFILLDNADIEVVSYLQSLVEVNENPAQVVAGYDNFDKHAEASRIRGVNTFLYDGTANQFKRGAIRSLTQKAKEQETPDAKIYAVYGVKGGVGATTITSILATDYAKKHPSSRVCVVDYSTKAGDIGALFGISQPVNNIYQYIQSMCKAKREHLNMDLLMDKVNQYCYYDKKRHLFVLPTTYTDVFAYTGGQITTAEIAYMYEYLIHSLRKNFDAIFIDVTKYAGFTYDLAISMADKIVLISDAKLASTSHLLTKYNELVGNNIFGTRANISILLNKTDIKHLENEYENYKIIEDKCGKDIITVFPVDKTLLREEVEMTINYGGKIKKMLPKLWEIINRQEK